MARSPNEPFKLKMNKLVDKVIGYAYNVIRRYIETLPYGYFWENNMVKPSRKAILYENVKLIGGLIAALSIVAGIAINVFTLPQRVTVVETKVLQSETRLALLEAKLDSLIADNKEMKSDIKELLRNKGGK